MFSYYLLGPLRSHSLGLMSSNESDVQSQILQSCLDGDNIKPDQPELFVPQSQIGFVTGMGCNEPDCLSRIEVKSATAVLELLG